MEMETGGVSASVIFDKEVDAMKDSFKYYKRRKPPPEFSQVVDFDQIGEVPASANGVEAAVSSYQLSWRDVVQDHERCGLNHPRDWKAYTLHSHPGLIFIQNPFTAWGQRRWAGRCLRDLATRPYKTNLDGQGLLPPGDSWWRLCNNGADELRLRKLRWVTLGFHHDWESKLYNMCDRSPFPSDLAQLCALLARAAGFADFAAEAAIVNFYHADSTLAPHTDRSEWDMSAPLLSLSFGQSAVFLLGGLDRSAPPAALLIRSGDVVIMSGQSRLCYHAVPRLLPSPDTRWHDAKRKLSASGEEGAEAAWKQARRSLDSPCHQRRRSDAIRCECDSREETCASSEGAMDTDHAATADDDAAVSSYLRNSRVNLNVRQVLPRGMMFNGAPG